MLELHFFAKALFGMAVAGAAIALGELVIKQTHKYYLVWRSKK